MGADHKDRDPAAPPWSTPAGPDSADGTRPAESGERQREIADDHREAAEEKREIAEGQREAAEEARQSLEGLRQIAEEVRSDAEVSRLAAEQTRAAAEQSRRNAEHVRQSSEEARIAAARAIGARDDIVAAAAAMQEGLADQQRQLDELRAKTENTSPAAVTSHKGRNRAD